ncbi:MAG: shikimate kinase [Lachnospiraceae bacterium]|nr:shikimate kinase [Lachnospiraceae bacterium]MCI9149227.1 shikimate kinase [Lachnospiraceae bacterium]
MDNIFLIGYMGTGKTTVSRQLGRRMKRLEVDLDLEIETRTGRTIPDIFEKEGEAYFRRLETKVIREYENKQGYVVSCGGGAPLLAENVESMRKGGVIVLLTASAHTVYQRVQGSKSRPLLNRNMKEEYIREMMEAREPYYRRAAQITVATDDKSPEELAAMIAEAVEKLQ